MINSYLSRIGYQGPNTLLLLILLMLTRTTQATNINLYIYVIVWQFISHLLNITIKNILKHPRPDSDKNEKFKTLVPTLSNYFTIHRNYGMPSGHAQAVMSELTFIILYFKQPFLSMLCIIQTSITLWQRYTTQRHSINQLIVGSAIGITVGVIFYKLIPFIENTYSSSSTLTSSTLPSSTLPPSSSTLPSSTLPSSSSTLPSSSSTLPSSSSE